MTPITHTLANGLRVVHIPSTSPVAWCGLAVDAGSRDDMGPAHGMAHMVEHNIFKGTAHRRSWHILNRMESVGGELNAYTTREHTMLYSVFPQPHLERALELIADMVMWSTFPQAEFEREMDVVLEEIDSYLDTPADAAYDALEDLMFDGSALGHNVLGTEQSVELLTPQQCSDFLKSHYVPQAMVLFVLGDYDTGEVMRLAERHYGAMHHNLERFQPRVTPAILEPQHRTHDVDLHQAHLVVGARVPGIYDQQRYAFMLLNNMLGGPGMNSMLNVELRERRGYVYTVESNLSLFTDSGLLEIYLGCDPRDLRASLDVIDHITALLASDPLPERRLEAAKRQYCGQLVVAADSSEYVAMSVARSLLYHNTVPSLERTAQRIMEVTPAQLQQAAAFITTPHCSTMVLR